MKPTSFHEAKARSFTPLPVHIADELSRYDAYLRDVRGLAAGTRRNQLRVVGLFLRQNFERRAVELRKLLPDNIRRFLASQLGAGCSSSYASQLASTLRSYLRYRTTRGDQVCKLSAVILNPVHWKHASLPRALKPEEVRHLLDAVAGARHWPRRNYAIVRLALDTGLRSGEIAQLMICDVDWREGTATLRGTKSLRQDVLPLPVETGQALADYLQHERPVISHPAIFVRQVAGRGQPITSRAIQRVIKRACCRIGLQHCSAHALRHTLACRLVENGSSLKEVADLLRHRSLNTTLIYAKLDTPKLATVALPWPRSQS
ncbi:tyrosine-type recombinase/integrase [Paraburkholderia youngii]|uniref:tyrosine-type recombinase/integrase n=1 Tax=Paraburkholderia youngii TaxID=2782701 RepID=UPI0015912FFB|nr:tyrosine-type recombinase/integrase [Paraburkholderia youngii]NUX59234.1 tyrosine-type recombinase/integrase [Paraburkholderia youngii]